MDSPMGSIDAASPAAVIERFVAVSAEQHPIDLLKALLAPFGCPRTNGSNAVDGWGWPCRSSKSRGYSACPPTTRAMCSTNNRTASAVLSFAQITPTGPNRIVRSSGRMRILPRATWYSAMASEHTPM